MACLPAEAKSEAEMPALTVHSVDIDGCLLNERDRNLRRIEANNKELIAHIKAHSDDRSILLCGSNRQSPHTDALNTARNKSLSLATILPKLAEWVGNGITLDPFLLSDIQSDGLEIGQSFQLCDPRRGYTKKWPSYAFDDSKLILLLTQMHKVAIENGGNITFTFYDDRPEILTALNDFLTTHPELIPMGVTLNLVQHDAKWNDLRESFVAHPPIVGKGATLNYRGMHSVLASFIFKHARELKANKLNYIKRFDSAYEPAAANVVLKTYFDNAITDPLESVLKSLFSLYFSAKRREREDIATPAFNTLYFVCTRCAPGSAAASPENIGDIVYDNLHRALLRPSSLRKDILDVMQKTIKDEAKSADAFQRTLSQYRPKQNEKGPSCAIM